MSESLPFVDVLADTLWHASQYRGQWSRDAIRVAIHALIAHRRQPNHSEPPKSSPVPATARAEILNRMRDLSAAVTTRLRATGELQDGGPVLVVRLLIHDATKEIDDILRLASIAAPISEPTSAVVDEKSPTSGQGCSERATARAEAMRARSKLQASIAEWSKSPDGDDDIEVHRMAADAKYFLALPEPDPNAGLLKLLAKLEHDYEGDATIERSHWQIGYDAGMQVVMAEIRRLIAEGGAA